MFIGEITIIAAISGLYYQSMYILMPVSVENHIQAYGQLVSWFIPFAWIYWLLVRPPIKEK